METLHLNSIQHSLFLLAFLIQFSSSPQFSSLGYVPQNKYFINCGSDTDVTANNHTYIGESKSGYPKTSFSSSNKENTLSSSVPSSTLYQTARVFQSPSWYEFSTVANGTYLVRLHFFAFASPTNLSTARFDVSVPEFWLLQNFNVRNTTNNNSALVKEFFVKITRNTFKITFRPLASSFAFVNAIELFELPLRLIADKVARFTFESDPSPAVSSYNDLLSRPSLGVSRYNGLLSRALETKHRLNVGGQKVTNDNLLRNWLPDDSYVINPGNAKNSSYNGTIEFTAGDDSEGPNSNQYTAPNDVYQSAREINANSTDGNLNITWGNIPVDKNTDHLLRFHFCDIFDLQSGLTIFLLYIYDRYVTNIVNEDPDISATLPAPYYYDFVVRSDNSGLLKISVAPNTTVVKPNAFLNGLEIMKVIEPSSSVPLDDSDSKVPLDDSDSKSKTRTTIAITVPVVAVILVLVIICIYLRVIKRKQKVNKENYDDENEDEITIVESLQFNFNTIRVATSDFCDSNKLGQGGFGAVYRGKLSNEQMIAVKRLSMNSDQGDVEFKNEVLLVAKLQHRNLVRLLGFSLEGRERLLIYEFVPNKSLNYFIFDPTRKAQLNWEKRYNIIKGIARGLLYLHEDSRLRIIHRDVKASNILLDSEMNPKISDFGLARLFVIDQTQEITSRIVGTYGYMAPEYVMHGQFSVKSDVFSFGVLVLEIISGQKNSTAIRHGEDEESLLTFAWRNWREGTITNIIDTSLNIISQNEMMRCIHIGLLCVQENLADRPTMATVALMLNSYLLTLSTPSKPAFVMDSRIGSLPDMQLWDDNSSAKRSIESVNKASITDPYPR